MSKNLNNKRFILETKDGTKWLFFLSSNNHILYRKLEEKESTQNNMVDSQFVKDFYATVDKDGIIRILAYTFSRQLIYYELIGRRWKRQVLERIYSRFQNISYFSILSSSNNIHILYYIESSLAKSAEFLIHYYLQEEKWYGGRLWRFISDEATTPQTAFVDLNNNLHIIFTKNKKDGNLALFHALFHSNSLLWTEPSFIHTVTDQCSQFQMYTDKNETIHLVWIENTNGIYNLKYLCQTNSNPPAWAETTLYKSSHEISSPTFIQDNELVCIWKEDDVLYQITSLDSGKTWGKAYSIVKDSDKQLNLFHFVSQDKNKIPLHSISIWGQGYPDVKLAGIERTEINTGLSLKQSGQLHNKDETAGIKSALSSINKEIKRNKTQIANMSSQLNELYSAIYELQEQLKLKEKSIYTIQAEIRRLGFEIRNLYKRTRAPVFNEPAKKSIPSVSDEIHKVNKEGENKSTEKNIKDQQPSKESNEPEKITLGNTTILINPDEDPEA